MKSALRALLVASAVLTMPVAASAQTYTEDFSAPFPAWESGWFGQNTNATNYYCGLSLGCVTRGNNLNGLWLAGTGGQSGNILLTFNSAFGSGITSISFFYAFHSDPDIYNITARDIFGNIISQQPLNAFTSLTTTGPVNYTVTTSTGLGSIEWESPDAAGNTAIDDITVNVAAVVATPEPASLLLLGTGLIGIVGVVRRKRATAA